MATVSIDHSTVIAIDPSVAFPLACQSASLHLRHQRTIRRLPASRTPCGQARLTLTRRPTALHSAAISTHCMEMGGREVRFNSTSLFEENQAMPD